MRTFLMLCMAIAVHHAVVAQAPATRAPRLDVGHGAQVVSADALLGRADVQAFHAEPDRLYAEAGPTYRVMPLQLLLPPAALDPSASVRFRSTDGFVTRILAADLLGGDATKTAATLAIEDTPTPWPPLPAPASGTAGPFALMWAEPDDAAVWSERWPSQLVEIAVASDAADQWPQMAVDATAPAAVHRVRQVMLNQCMVCHHFAEACNARVGPELATPMSPVRYFSHGVLRLYVRDPSSVRDWPGRTMNGFSPSVQSDQDLDALIAVMRHEDAAAFARGASK